MKEKSIKAFQEVADFTAGICQRMCKKLGACCSTEYCLMAIEVGASEGVTYTPTGNARLPMFDDEKKQCIAAPHHRQLCTMHHCEISSVGVIRGMPEETKVYFKLYDKVNEALCEEFDLKF